MLYSVRSRCIKMGSLLKAEPGKSISTSLPILVFQPFSGCQLFSCRRVWRFPLSSREAIKSCHLELRLLQPSCFLCCLQTFSWVWKRLFLRREALIKLSFLMQALFCLPAQILPRKKQKQTSTRLIVSTCDSQVTCKLQEFLGGFGSWWPQIWLGFEKMDLSFLSKISICA